MTEYALEINGLKKVYDNDVEALKGIDLKITKGDFFSTKNSSLLFFFGFSKPFLMAPHEFKNNKII